MRLLVLKTCKVCEGKGGGDFCRFTPETTAGNVFEWETCQACEGRGYIETDTFVEYSCPPGYTEVQHA